MTEIIHLENLHILTNAQLTARYKLAEWTCEQAIEYMKCVGDVLQSRQAQVPVPYDDFHDVFPEDPA